MSEQRPVITIDGPAGAGKSTLARLLARRLGFFLLDTGALYRAVALHLTRLGISPDRDPVPDAALESVNLRVEPQMASMKVFLGDEDVGQLIRDEKIASVASRFSAKPEVRRALLLIQRSAAAGGGVVAEGRDMGTVVFPQAPVKFFLTADVDERAHRRYLELLERREITDLSEVRAELLSRDKRDESRPEAPLIRPPDATVVDTTGLSPMKVLDVMVARIVEKSGIRPPMDDSDD